MYFLIMENGKDESCIAYIFDKGLYLISNTNYFVELSALKLF